MAVPDFQTIMLPLMKLLVDGEARRVSDLAEQVAEQFGLTEAERMETLSSGQRRLVNRVWWARTDLVKANLLESSSRGSVRLTQRGREVLAENPERVDRKFLSRYPDYRAFLQASSPSSVQGQTHEPGLPHEAQDIATTIAPPQGIDASSVYAEEIAVDTPQEAMQRAHHQLETALADDVLSRIKALSPGFFESLVIKVLVAMGYGGTIQDAAQVVGQSGDGGIDGTIKEDKLGLDTIYVQAKRWESTVGRPIVQAFYGSLAGRQATKGVFITTATFSAEARDYVRYLPMRIVLIDGPTLARLMIDHNVGVSIVSTYHLKRVDSDYFSEEGL